MELEATVLKQTKYKLRDFVKSISGGVTPKVTEYDKYYTDSKDGIPFLRVQNLSAEGLKLENCNYINHETHETLLKRSQVTEGDLLIKITGVGRMAITSIAPENFVGNINQHMVVMKCKDLELKEQIATFLNSDIGEMLATRRTTGGTRPALDYRALRSIPIILNDDIWSIMDRAYTVKKEKEKQAQKLLDKVDEYLLDELGIAMPKNLENTLENRMFYVNSKNVLGGRFDPKIYMPYYKNIELAMKQNKFDIKKLGDVTDTVYQGITVVPSTKNENVILKVKNIQKYYLDVEDIEYTSVNNLNKALMNNDILTPFIGEAIRKFKFAIFNKLENDKNYFVDGNVGVIRPNNVVNSKYLCYYLNSTLTSKQIEKLIGGGMPFLGSANAKNILVILPSIERQDIIANEISNIINTSFGVMSEAEEVLQNAKEEVEKILRGEI